MVRITITAIEQLASDINSVLKYFHGYWKTMKIFLSHIFNNEIIPNKIFSEHGRKNYICDYRHIGRYSCTAD